MAVLVPVPGRAATARANEDLKRHTARWRGLPVRENKRQPWTAGPRPSQTPACAAIIDRLTVGGTIIETGTGSYRLAGARARTQAPAEAG